MVVEVVVLLATLVVAVVAGVGIGAVAEHTLARMRRRWLAT
jgi:hypothetical protein